MPWSRRDDGTYLNRKVNAVGDQAYILWTYAIDYSSQQLTDGVLFPREVAMLCGMRGYANWQDLADELVNARLFDRCDDGNFEIHDFLTYNPTRQKVLADRARHAMEQAKWQAQRAPREPLTERLSEHITDDAPSHPVPSRPVKPPPPPPAQETEKVEGNGHDEEFGKLWTMLTNERIVVGMSDVLRDDVREFWQECPDAEKWKQGVTRAKARDPSAANWALVKRIMADYIRNGTFDKPGGNRVTADAARRSRGARTAPTDAEWEALAKQYNGRPGPSPGAMPAV